MTSSDILLPLLYVLIFPGFAFLTVFALAGEWFDRFTYARMQNRIGPPWFQPWADVIKLAAKEETVPESADPGIFKFMPLLALTTTVTSILYIPLWGSRALFSFQGDVVVVLYLLTIPTLSFFLGAWFSRSTYSLIGASRAITQLFAYEIPLLLAVLAPAMLADSWSLSEIATYYSQGRWWLWLVNLPAFAIAAVALLGKLERVPFDIPEAETEIVAGTFTEYGGRLLALFRLCVDIEMIVGGSLLAAVFLPLGLDLESVVGPEAGPILGFVLYLLKVLLVIEALAFLRTVMARIRIDQMVSFCWKYMAPLALAQLVVNLVVKGFVQ